MPTFGSEARARRILSTVLLILVIALVRANVHYRAATRPSDGGISASNEPSPIETVEPPSKPLEIPGFSTSSAPEVRGASPSLNQFYAQSQSENEGEQNENYLTDNPIRLQMRWQELGSAQTDTSRIEQMADELEEAGRLIRTHSQDLYGRGIYNAHLMASDFESAASDLRKLARAAQYERQGLTGLSHFNDFDRMRLGRNLYRVGEHMQRLGREALWDSSCPDNYLLGRQLNSMGEVFENVGRDLQSPVFP